jgi:hypothetical protein
MAIPVYIDENWQFITPSGGQAQFQPFVKNSNPLIYVYPVQLRAVAAGANPTVIYDPVNWAGASLVGSLCNNAGNPVGTTAATVLIAKQETWTWDAANSRFSARLECNSPGFASYIGSEYSKPSLFEIYAVLADGTIGVAQTPVQVVALNNDTGATGPAPAPPLSWTRAESDNRFVKVFGDPGVLLTLRSPSSTFGRELGVDDAGNRIDNIIAY